VKLLWVACALAVEAELASVGLGCLGEQLVQGDVEGIADVGKLVGVDVAGHGLDRADGGAVEADALAQFLLGQPDAGPLGADGASDGKGQGVGHVMNDRPVGLAPSHSIQHCAMNACIVLALIGD